MAEQLKARAIDDILEVLSDGKFHTVDQIESGCRKLNGRQVMLILDFLSEYGFIDRYRRRWPGPTDPLIIGANLTDEMANFLRQVKDLES